MAESNGDRRIEPNHFCALVEQWYRPLFRFAFRLTRDAAVGTLPKRGVKTMSVNLAAGRSYVFVAGGCEDAFDVDVMVYD